MGADRLFPPAMPDPGPAVEPLDHQTAERLLRGQLDPLDAPPSYREVARVLQAAAAPATPEELAGEPAALATFRAVHAQREGGRDQGDVAGGRAAGGWPARGGGGGGRRGRGRARLVALALAGILTVGGLWMAGGARTAGELRSPTGGSGAGRSGSGTSESLSPARPVTGPGMAPPATGPGASPGTGPGGGVAGRPHLPSAGDRRSTAPHNGGATSRGGRAGHGTRPGAPGRPPKAKPAKPKPPKPEQARPKAAKPHPTSGAAH
jgi:hypothetical protein